MVRSAILLWGLVSCLTLTAAVASEEQTLLPQPVKRAPGEWQTVMKIIDIDMPGLPAEAKKAALAQQLPATTECLSKEDAEKEDPGAEFTKSSGGGSCTFSKKQFLSIIDVAGICKGPDGKDVSMTLKGTFNPKRIELDIESAGPSPRGKGRMTSKMHITATNAGPC